MSSPHAFSVNSIKQNPMQLNATGILFFTCPRVPSGSSPDWEHYYSMTESILSEVPRLLWYFFISALFALTEIEIEGRFGWAKHLPTAKDTKSFFASKILSKPFTMYHFLIFSIVFAGLHNFFFEGIQWTLNRELRTVSQWLIMIVTWDFLWFVFNPFYTWRGYRKDKLPWYSGAWFMRVSTDYYIALLFYFIFSLLGNELYGGIFRFIFYLILTGISVLIAPLYHRLYFHLRVHHPE
ncbi:hypothetical protein BH10BAC5_BH10BAC5_26190 [soil metagenome]